MKKQNGITLIALIITIIVLLILAIVTIGAVQDSDIIGHAENAATTYNQAKANEITAMSGYEELINSITLNFWQQKGVTSENVKFDTLYCGIVNLYGDPNTAMHFGFYSNGDLCFNISDTLDTNFSIKDADGNNNIGNQGLRKENAETLLSVVKILPNGYTGPLGNIGYHTIRYTANNTVEVYFVDNDSASTVLVDGHIPEDTAYLVGTLEQQ